MSLTDRLAELQELFLGLGVAIMVLVAIVWLISTFGTTNPKVGAKQNEPKTVRPQLQSRGVPAQGFSMDPPVVSALYIASAAGLPMERVDHVTAVARRGLEGDRYYRDKGHWSGTDECEVTIITQERIDEIEQLWGVKIQDGEHRRNIVTRNLPIEKLAGRRFHIGSATFGYERPRPPCAYIQMITEQGMTKALGRDAGICVRCIKGGEIRPGDQIVISTITLSQALRYRARLMLRQWQNRSEGHN